MPRTPVAEDFEAIRQGMARLEGLRGGQDDGVFQDIEHGEFAHDDEAMMPDFLDQLLFDGDEDGGTDGVALCCPCDLWDALPSRHVSPQAALVHAVRRIAAAHGTPMPLAPSVQALLDCMAGSVVHAVADATPQVLFAHAQLGHLRQIMDWRLHPDVPQSLRAAIQAYLISLPGFDHCTGSKQSHAVMGMHALNLYALKLSRTDATAFAQALAEMAPDPGTAQVDDGNSWPWQSRKQDLLHEIVMAPAARGRTLHIDGNVDAGLAHPEDIGRNAAIMKALNSLDFSQPALQAAGSEALAATMPPSDDAYHYRLPIAEDWDGLRAGLVRLQEEREAAMMGRQD